MSIPLKHSIIRSTGIIGFATSISRILGFVRDIIIANLFGTGLYAQAFIVAFRIPNLLRDLVGEGATNAAFVPVLSEYHVSKSGKEYWRLSQIILSLLLIALTILTVLGTVLSPVIVRLVAPGFINEPSKLDLTIRLTQFMFPYILLIALSAYSMGILNSLGHFSSPAFGPCVFNIIIIVFSILLYRAMGIWAVAWGVLAGGLMQFAIQIPPLYKQGWTIRWDPDSKHPGARKIGKLLIPRALGSAVYQLNVFIDTVLASFSNIVGAGGIAALYYANRLIQLPVAIFGIALATAILPLMSRYAVQHEMEKLKETLSFSLRSIFFVMLPATAGFIGLGLPIIKILFQRGEFNAYSTYITQMTTAYCSIGLFAYAGVKILAYAFYSIQDTRTPVKTAGLSLLANLVLNLSLMWPLKIGGIALASSISNTLNFSMLFWLLNKKIGNIGTKKILNSFIHSLAASLVMLVFCVFTRGKLDSFLLAHGSKTGAIALLFVICCAMVIYAIVAYIINPGEIKEIIKWLLKKH